jgi:molecular chaperone DnaJ
MSQKRDYYEILGVTKNSSKDEIKKAYRKLAMQYHPDRNPGDKASEAKFKEASEAADALLDDQKKARYDQFGHEGMNGAGGFPGGGFSGDFGDLGDIFGDIFGDILGGRGQRRRGGSGRSRAQAGSDLETEVELTFEEAAFGVEKTITIQKSSVCQDCSGTGAKKGSSPTTCDFCHGHGEVRRQQGFFTIAQPCPKCQGSGQMVKDPCQPCYGKGRIQKKESLSVKVPAGIDEGQRLKISNQGDAGAFGGPSGDLYVQVHLKEHEFFNREGFDVLCEVPISFSQATLGADIEVPTLSGRVSLKIPAGTQSGKKMRIKNKGIARLGNHSGFGDQIIGIHVETPTKLTPEQRDLFEKLASLEQKHSNPMTKGFLDKVKDLFQ